MVTDEQLRRLRKLIKKGTRATAAVRAGIDEKTARRYLRSVKLPSEVRPEHGWRTRVDAFEEVWDDLRRKLALHQQLGSEDTV